MLLVPEEGTPEGPAGREWVSREQRSLIEALKEGHTTEEELFLKTRDLLDTRASPRSSAAPSGVAASDLAQRGLIAIEDGEYFILETGRDANYATRRAPSAAAQRRAARLRGW